MGFSISRYTIISVLFVKIFTFGYYDFNLKRMLQLKSGDIETNPGPWRSCFIKLFYWN